jgi:hypothetical protein
MTAGRLPAVRARLLEMAGDTVAADRDAARRTTSLPERRCLAARAMRAGKLTSAPV